MSHSPRVVLIHAYRRSNAGDGLLVDEAASLVREALPGAHLTLVSLEPPSFPEFAAGLHPLSGHAERLGFTAVLRATLARTPHPQVRAAIESADLAVAVGGGYLRAAGPRSAIKTYLAHITQLPSRRSTTPYVYLPQSIGPLPPPWVPFGTGRLRRAHAVYVRDDRSHREVRDRSVDAVRMPDLAVLQIGRSEIRPVERVRGRIGLVARSLDGPDRGYRARVRKLHELLAPEVLVQSSGAGNDDPKFYAELGIAGSGRRLLDALPEPGGPGSVVSVRLHGSLQSILAGVPSVHLSYERKGWGAYEDLGVGEYVHHAWTFDPELVAEQARALRDSPASFWGAVRERSPGIRLARNTLVEQLRAAVDR